MKNLIFGLLSSMLSLPVLSQKITICADSISSSFRGLSVVDNNVVWVSGSNGTIGRSINGGDSWKWMNVKGFANTDFRDIEAFDENMALIMGVDTPAYILRTIDGGETWKVVYKNNSAGMFLDAMEFSNDQNGIVIGDPVNDHFFMAKTFDGGKSWQDVPMQNRPTADSDEACFAASGTNVRIGNNSGVVFISGGLTSHVFINQDKFSLPILQGKESTGANSIAIKNDKFMIVVGGDFLQKDDTIGICALSADGGKTWTQPKTRPSGYRSCVEFLSGKKWITCGLNGVDLSNDDGMNWQKISDQSFNVVRKAKKGNAVYFAGSKGNVGKMEQ